MKDGAEYIDEELIESIKVGNWQSTNPLDLPSIALARRSALPHIRSVYFLIEADMEIIYIGQAANLRSRWTNHHCLEKCEPTAQMRIAWLEIQDPGIRNATEKSLIRQYQPRLNVQVIQPVIAVEEKLVESLQGKITINVAEDFLFERTDGKRNLREEQFANVVGASERTVRRFRREGLIQCHMYGSRVYYLYPDDVAAWHETMRKVPIRSARLVKQVVN